MLRCPGRDPTGRIDSGLIPFFRGIAALVSGSGHTGSAFDRRTAKADETVVPGEEGTDLRRTGMSAEEIAQESYNRDHSQAAGCSTWDYGGAIIFDVQPKPSMTWPPKIMVKCLILTLQICVDWARGPSRSAGVCPLASSESARGSYCVSIELTDTGMAAVGIQRTYLPCYY